MRVLLLGTGSMTGWPDPFCRCASCLAGRAGGRLRSPSSALVDDTLLLDYPPEAGRAALLHPGGLAAVRHLLVTGAQPGQGAPTALLSRAWAGGPAPLTIAAPPSVVATWRAGIGAGPPVTFTPVGHGDELTLGGYRVRVLAAGRHRAERRDDVLYDVTGPDGARLWYAADTGPLPARTRTATAGAAYDLVLLDAGFGDRGGPGSPSGGDHLDLAGVADELRAARGTGAITDRTDVVAVHLSHHSPSDLERRLARWGARVVDDGAELLVGAAGAPVRRAGVQPRRTLVLGGARSGKSLVAERLLQAEPVVTYVAAGPAPSVDDPEWTARVRVHRERRPAHWVTAETTDVAAAVRTAHHPVLVDCLGTWLAAVLDEAGAWDARPGWSAQVDARVDELVEAWHDARVTCVAVGNEVGSGVVPPVASGRLFRDLLGALNTRVATASERVLLVVAGREIDLSSNAEMEAQS